ncbi:MAG: NigD-like N-terminal domain-containing protein, partial [Bacteroidales bacterium]|nr:NigD-like N-terminal domain-containing protein [Bacteroidales bacterium]
MKKLNIYLLSMMMIVTSFSLVSCDDDDDCYADILPTALVTVYPQGDNAFTMQLDDKTTLVPTNMKASPFGEKEVRALVNYVEESSSNGSYRNVRVNWIDSIRTKYPVMTTDDDNLTYGNDPIEIVRDWLTVAEDGFLTLRIRTLWGVGQGPHIVNLVYGTEEGSEETLVLHHDAQ